MRRAHPARAAQTRRRIPIEPADYTKRGANLTAPDYDVQKKFADFISPLFAKVDLLSALCGKLAEARDRLSLKLMSGEIEV